MIQEIRVEMLGGLSVWADGTAVLDTSARANKPWQVFCFLALGRGAPVSSGKIIAALWPDEDLTDPPGVLKSTVYALRKEFAAAEPHESPILHENGGYLINPVIHLVLDTERFEQKIQAAGMLRDAERLAALGEAVDLYRGDLLPQLEGEAWVMPRALYYRQLYTQSVLELCEGLHGQKMHNQLLAAATMASRIDPLEERFYVYTFRALYALGMYRAIIPAYTKTARFFGEELGVGLGGELTRIYTAASEQVDSIERDIMIIKDDLREVTQESGPVNGPLYCTYDVFKYLYQMVARSSERSGGSVVIVLLTLQQKDGTLPPPKTLSNAMGQLKTLILNGLLRKSDTVARYSKSQYIIMLSVDKAGGAELVIDRVRKRCQPLLAPGGIEPVFATTELERL